MLARVKKMRIKYENPYSTEKAFLLRTDRPDLLVFEADKLIVPGKDSKPMVLLFQPQPTGTNEQLFIFINDTNDLVLETICINGMWSL